MKSGSDDEVGKPENNPRIKRFFYLAWIHTEVTTFIKLLGMKSNKHTRWIY